jgi:hypothetical protein
LLKPAALREEREAKTKVTQSILIELAKTPLNARL